MKTRLYLSIFFFILSAVIAVIGTLMVTNIYVIIIALLIAYIYGLVGLLFLSLYLKDKIQPNFKI